MKFTAALERCTSSLMSVAKNSPSTPKASFGSSVMTRTDAKSVRAIYLSTATVCPAEQHFHPKWTLATLSGNFFTAVPRKFSRLRQKRVRRFRERHDYIAEEKIPFPMRQRNFHCQRRRSRFRKRRILSGRIQHSRTSLRQLCHCSRR